MISGWSLHVLDDADLAVRVTDPQLAIRESLDSVGGKATLVEDTFGPPRGLEQLDVSAVAVADHDVTQDIKSHVPGAEGVLLRTVWMSEDHLPIFVQDHQLSCEISRPVDDRDVASLFIFGNTMWIGEYVACWLSAEKWLFGLVLKGLKFLVV